MATQSERQDLGRYCLQTAWLFQALCALPTLLILGFLAFAQLFEPHIYLYDFMYARLIFPFIRDFLLLLVAQARR